MDVTRKNFKETLPIVEKSIRTADFLVIDCEFTGLINGREVSIFDLPSEYYSRLLNGCSDFMLIQFGLCAFVWDQEGKQYLNEAYNFYLFPRGRPGPERMFLCQSTSLDFLAAQGFDFNKLIKEGISYMTEPTESKLREFLTEKQRTYSYEKENITIPEENKQQIEDICKRVREFLDENKSNEMEIDRCNAFIRRLLFQELGARFKNEAFVETKILENKNRVLKVSRVTSEGNNKDRDVQKKEREWEDFEEAVGFSKVARMISQCEKLVIGHNMVLDVLHTLNHFFQPLPADYSSFKEFAHCMFPRLLDTKYMSSLPPFKDKVNSNVLPHLFATLSEPPFTRVKVACEDGRGYMEAEEKQHEAGYDAYVTGLCFLSMQAHLADMRGESARRVNADAALLKPFLNKLYLARTAYQDSPYINLAGKEPIPSRDHVFYITFPKEWQRNDLNQLFSPFGPITVQFLDDTSALVALSRREQARDALLSLSNGSSYVLMTYAKYKLCLAKGYEKRRKMTELSSSAVRSVPDVSLSTKVGTSTSSTPETPVRVERQTADSTSTTPSLSPSPSSRKRTSSGVFQVDEAEPPAKKTEVSASDTELIRRPPEVPRLSTETPRTYSQVTRTPIGDSRAIPAPLTNGRRKVPVKTDDQSSTSNNKKQEEVLSEKKVIERFDRSDNVSQCVNAFQESDSWD